MCVQMLYFLEVTAMLKRLREYFSAAEILIWSVSIILETASFVIFDRENYLFLIAALTGITYLILNAKGNPLGQVLVIVFSIIYGVISYSFSYYGEMATYLGMTLPMAVFALISWLRNPFNGNRAEVTVGSIGRAEVCFMTVLAGAVTVLFYFILRSFNTANLLPSTLSVTTSFIAVYLTFRRNPFYAIAYAANDIVLICLWTLASLTDTRYISVVVCFAVFLFNDIYSFFCWNRMKERQAESIQTLSP